MAPVVRGTMMMRKRLSSTWVQSFQHDVPIENEVSSEFSPDVSSDFNTTDNDNVSYEPEQLPDFDDTNPSTSDEEGTDMGSISMQDISHDSDSSDTDEDDEDDVTATLDAIRKRNLEKKNEEQQKLYEKLMTSTIVEDNLQQTEDAEGTDTGSTFEQDKTPNSGCNEGDAPARGDTDSTVFFTITHHHGKKNQQQSQIKMEKTVKNAVELEDAPVAVNPAPRPTLYYQYDNVTMSAAIRQTISKSSHHIYYFICLSFITFATMLYIYVFVIYKKRYKYAKNEEHTGTKEYEEYAGTEEYDEYAETEEYDEYAETEEYEEYEEMKEY